MTKCILQRVWALCLTLATVVLSSTAQTPVQYPAGTGSTLLYKVLPNGVAAVVGVSEIKNGKVVIPSSVFLDGKTRLVRSIYPNAINGGDSLLSVVIPQRVDTIKENAFSGSTALKSVFIMKTYNQLPSGFSADAFSNALASNAIIYVPDGYLTQYRSRYPNLKIIDPRLQMKMKLADNGGRIGVTFSSTATKAYVALRDASLNVIEVVEWTINGESSKALSSLFANNITDYTIEVYSSAANSYTLTGLNIQTIDRSDNNNIQTLRLNSVKWPQNKLIMPTLTNLLSLNVENMPTLTEIDLTNLANLTSLNISGDMTSLTPCALDRMLLTLRKRSSGTATCTFTAGAHNDEILAHSKTYVTDHLGWVIKKAGVQVTGDGTGCDSLYLLCYNKINLGKVNGEYFNLYSKLQPIPRNTEMVVVDFYKQNQITAMQINGKPVALTGNNTFNSSDPNVVTGVVTTSVVYPKKLTITQLADTSALPSFIPYAIPAGSAAVKYRLPNYALVLRELADEPTPQFPQGSEIDLMARYGHPYTSFRQHRWAEISAHKVWEEDEQIQGNGYYVDKLLPRDMVITPNIYESNSYRFWGMDLGFQAVKDTVPYNTYTLAALDGVQTATDGNSYFFMRPTDAEVCYIVADWDGQKLIIPTQSMRNLLGRTIPTLPGDVNYRFNITPSPTLQAGETYKFLAYVRYNRYNEQPSTNDAPARPRRIPLVERNSYMIYPIDLDGTRISTGITDVVTDMDEASPIVATDYVDASGRVSDKPFSGLNIIRHHHANGSVTTSKQIIR